MRLYHHPCGLDERIAGPVPPCAACAHLITSVERGFARGKGRE